jgi:hypothetical protein
VIEEKNAAIQIKTGGAKNAYKLDRNEREAFVQKKGKAARRIGFNRD